MFGFYKEEFECLIDTVEDSVAFVTLIDKDGNESNMEIPFEDLQKYKVECIPGILFIAIFKRWRNLEKMTFIPLFREAVTQKEFDELTEYYEEKYKDV